MGGQKAFLQSVHRVLNVRKLSYFFTSCLCPLPFNFSRKMREIFVRAITVGLASLQGYTLLYFVGSFEYSLVNANVKKAE